MRAVLALALAAAAPGPRGDVAAIRAARAHSNAAIAARDVAALRADYVDDYTLIRGTGGDVLRGADAAVANFAGTDFKAASFVAYVRVPDTIIVAAPRDRAMERGHWIGTWHHPEGRRTGEYLAVWVPSGDGWKLRSESFVTLTETGGIPR